MTAATSPQVPGRQATSALAPETTLRALLEARRAEGRRVAIEEIVAVAVPVCLDAKERHARGERFFLHPSTVAPGPDGIARVVPGAAMQPPTHPRDRFCLAPEILKSGEPGDARASVFALGAMLYEALTGEHVGPGMRRPREVDPNIPEHLELLLAKALVGDPTHRPDDLGALASAMYHLAPGKSIHPPEVPESKIDASAELDVDVRLSLLPPEELAQQAPAAPGARAPVDPFGNVVVAPGSAAAPVASTRVANDPTTRLAALKQRLESDGRPRYVVNKDRMDHGPFSAVELLQQIASGAFRAEHGLRDELSGQSLPIGEWEEFAPFADQARLKQEIVAEKREVAAQEKSEKKAGIAKTLIGVGVVALILAGGVSWYLKVRGARSDDVNVVDDTVAGVDGVGGIKGQQRRAAGGRGGGGGGGGGGFPAGMSYEAALASNNQEMTIGQKSGPDLTDAQLSAPMRNAAFLDACGAPQSMKVTVRVAVKMGRAVGVSVYTIPPNPQVAGCVDRAVRGLSWPANAKMDSFTTNY